MTDEAKKLAELFSVVSDQAAHRKIVVQAFQMLVLQDECLLETIKGFQQEQGRAERMRRAISDFLKWENKKDRGIQGGHPDEWLKQTEKLAIAIQEPDTD